VVCNFSEENLSQKISFRIRRKEIEKHALYMLVYIRMQAVYIYFENYCSILPGKNKHNSVSYIFSWFTEKKKGKDVIFLLRNSVCLLVTPYAKCIFADM
jgi:hypothetical protein